jgi:hypothetical protein
MIQPRNKNICNIFRPRAPFQAAGTRQIVPAPPPPSRPKTILEGYSFLSESVIFWDYPKRGCRKLLWNVDNNNQHNFISQKIDVFDYSPK